MGKEEFPREKGARVDLHGKTSNFQNYVNGSIEEVHFSAKKEGKEEKIGQKEEKSLQWENQN
jgi:hypothetical protein